MTNFVIDVSTTHTQSHTITLQATSESQAKALALAGKGEWTSPYPPELEEITITSVREA